MAGISSIKLLSVEEAAQVLSISIAWLNNARAKGVGPRFIKIGSRVLYDQTDLAAWLEDQKRCSTASGTPAAGLAKIPPFPDSRVRQAFAYAKGERWTISYLDTAQWDPHNRVITAHLEGSRKKLAEALMREQLGDLKVTVAARPIRSAA